MNSQEDTFRKRSKTNKPLGFSSWLFTFLQMLIIGCIVVSGYWAYLKITSPKTFPFRHVKLTASYKHISPRALSHIITADLNGGFFSLNINQLENDLLMHPWVASAAIRRVWPDTLLVYITEKVPVASWNHKMLITADGNVFAPQMDMTRLSLPELIGPQDQMQEVIQQYQFFSDKLKILHLAVHQLDLSAGLAWKIMLSNGIQIILGRDPVNDRFVRFVRLYPAIVGNKSDQVDSINLCYSSGLSVLWKNINANSSNQPNPTLAKLNLKVGA